MLCAKLCTHDWCGFHCRNGNLGQVSIPASCSVAGVPFPSVGAPVPWALSSLSPHPGPPLERWAPAPAPLLVAQVHPLPALQSWAPHPASISLLSSLEAEPGLQPSVPAAECRGGGWAALSLATARTIRLALRGRGSLCVTPRGAFSIALKSDLP